MPKLKMELGAEPVKVAAIEPVAPADLEGRRHLEVPGVERREHGRLRIVGREPGEAADPRRHARARLQHGVLVPNAPAPASGRQATILSILLILKNPVIRI